MASSVLPRGVRTFKPRRGRITDRQQAALDDPGGALSTLAEVMHTFPWPPSVPVVMEIGFGAGEAVIEYAQGEPGTGVLAVDIHTPGVGRLLADARDRGLTNIRVIEADALAVLEWAVPPRRLCGVRTFFPDPWPKVRHHKRRLVQPAVLDLVHSRLIPGGTWPLATDQPEYADWMLAVFTEHPGFEGGVARRRPDRPITHYERRAMDAGRRIIDFSFTTIDVE